MRLLDLIKKAADYLEAAGKEDALPDAERLVLHAAGTDRITAYVENPEIDSRFAAKAMRLVKRRAEGEPLQYILGAVEFLGMTITVGPGVLIPRPETELLVEEAIKTVQSSEFNVQSLRKNIEHGTSNLEPLSILDLCTGSGCIALALAREFPNSAVVGTDVSSKALRYARKNAETNAIRNVQFLKGPLFAALKKSGKYDLIISNPPYIRSSDIAGLQQEIRDWEPRTALDGGEDGLDFYRDILGQAGEHLAGRGTILFEIGFDQADGVAAIANANGFNNVSFIKDFAGIRRICRISR